MFARFVVTLRKKAKLKDMPSKNKKTYKQVSRKVGLLICYNRKLNVYI